MSVNALIQLIQRIARIYRKHERNMPWILIFFIISSFVFLTIEVRRPEVAIHFSVSRTGIKEATAQSIMGLDDGQ